MQFRFDDNGNEILPIPKSVTQINEYIKYLVEGEMILQDVYIIGEISNYKKNLTGHFYFTLKDERSEIKAIMFRAHSQKVRFALKDGMSVIAHGRLGVYEPQGTYQLYIDSIQPNGVGELYLQYEQLKNRLEKEGLFSLENKMPIPRFPETIGVITSPSGAAVQDIINIATRRYPMAKIVIFPSLVQGQDAPDSLIQGVEYFNITSDVDVILLGRGGGSIEDLWAFNDERLARAIHRSKIPIISCVGHETDFTICDFVSDLRAPTPSAAAELATPDIIEIKMKLASFEKIFSDSISSLVSQYRDKLSVIATSRVLKKPETLLEAPKLRLDRLSESLVEGFLMLKREKNMTFEKVNAQLYALNPMAVLSRGYGVIYSKNKILVKSKNDVNIGEEISVQLKDGVVYARVEGKED